MRVKSLTCLLFLGCAALPGQAAWRTAGSWPCERTEIPLCYDSLRGRSFAYGGITWTIRLTDTWSYRDRQWTRLDVPAGPVLFHPQCAYDRTRDRVVLFGFTMVPGNREPKTYEFDGTQWLDRAPANAPDSSSHSGSSQALAYDELRGVTVMVVGDEVWEWDGVDWTERMPTQTPWFAYGQRLVYHAGLGGVVLLASVQSPPGSTLWQWTGNDWTLLDSAGPPLRAFGMTYDRIRDRLVLFGGYDAGTSSTDQTWEWDGTAWTQRTPAVSPDPRYSCSLVYDEQSRQVVLLGGDSNVSNSDRLTRRETWQWDGLNWQETTPPLPDPRTEAALVYERHTGRLLQFGGRVSLQFPNSVRDELWAYDDAVGWQLLPQNTAPPPSAGHTMAYDERRSLTVLCGQGLWEYGAGTWRLRAPGISGFGGEVVYDSLRERCVLVQASMFGSPLRMFAWDGTTLVELFPTTMPSDREGFAMAYDRARDEIVLFGGRAAGAGTRFGDTWIYDGADWQQRAVSGPSAREQAAMAYDAARDRTVLHGGLYSGPFYTGQSWEWDGSAWTATAIGSTRSQQNALVYDPDRRRVVGSEGSLTQLWVYETDEPARVDAFGAGCGGTAGTAQLAAAAAGLPWIGDTMRLRVEAVPTVPVAPVFAFGQAPANVDLAPFGAPGCTLLVTPFATTTMQPVAGGASGRAVVDVPIPATAALVGVSFFGQTFAFDPPANALGIVASGGVEVVSGVR